MPRLKSIGYSELERKLKRAGFIPIRKNKHIIYFHFAKQITIPIPHKHSSDISKELLSKLIKEMQFTVEEFNNL